jgi:hypothetical protein
MTCSSFAGNKKYSPFFIGKNSSFVFLDSTKKSSGWSRAKKATVMSICLPGLGQAYNKKYWKVPVVYGLLGGMGYLIIQNNSKYQDYHNALIYRYDSDLNNDTFSQYTVENLITLKRSYRRYRDLSILGASLIYLLQVIDANVDGHLTEFDVDNISMKISPWQSTVCSAGKSNFYGLNFTLKF